MAYKMAFALIAAAAAMFGMAIAQPTTTGSRFEGYTYASNVLGYVNMTMDYCDIQAAISADNFTRALEIYTTGKNSFSGLARRTFYRLATVTSAPGSPEPIHDSLAMGRNATWLDSLIKNAFMQRNGALALGLLQVAAIKYGLHEVDEGFASLEKYVQDPASNSALISDASGTAHSVDEFWALWSGGRAEACATFSRWAAKLGAELEATFLGNGFINGAVTLATNELQAAGRNGTVDVQAYNSTRYALQRTLTVLGLQGVVHSSYRQQAATACKRTASEVAEAKAMATVHWTYLQPMLAARGVASSTITQLGRAINAVQPVYRNTLPAVRSVASALGLRMSEIGAPNFGLVTAGWRCNATIPAARRLLAA